MIRLAPVALAGATKRRAHAGITHAFSSLCTGRTIGRVKFEFIITAVCHPRQNGSPRPLYWEPVNLAFFQLRLHYRAGESVRFPPCKAANTLRGAFGASLRSVACVPECTEACTCL